jgi:hypothetical protein
MMKCSDYDVDICKDENCLHRGLHYERTHFSACRLRLMCKTRKKWISCEDVGTEFSERYRKDFQSDIERILEI